MCRQFKMEMKRGWNIINILVDQGIYVWELAVSSMGEKQQKTSSAWEHIWLNQKAGTKKMQFPIVPREPTNKPVEFVHGRFWHCCFPNSNNT